MSFRCYDLAVMRFVSVELDGVVIPKVFAPPSRVFARLAEHLQLGRPEDPSSWDYTRMPTPVISVSAGDIAFSTERYKGRQSVWGRVEPGDKFVSGGRFPLAYDLSYQVDFWYKNRAQRDFVTHLFLSRFSPDIGVLEVDYKSEVLEYADRGVVAAEKSVAEWGRSFDYVLLEGWENTSELQPDEGSDVRFRNTASLLVHGWLFDPPERVGVVEHFEVKTQTSSSGSEDFVMYYDSEKDKVVEKSL